MYRTNLQICDAVAAVLKAEDAIPSLAREAAGSRGLTEEILRDRLAVHRVPQHAIEMFVTRWKGAKEAGR